MEAFLAAVWQCCVGRRAGALGLLAAGQCCGLLVLQGLVWACHAREDKELVL